MTAWRVWRPVRFTGGGAAGCIVANCAVGLAEIGAEAIVFKPAIQGSLGDTGLADHNGEGALGEQRPDGAFLGGKQPTYLLRFRLNRPDNLDAFTVTVDDLADCVRLV